MKKNLFVSCARAGLLSLVVCGSGCADFDEGRSTGASEIAEVEQSIRLGTEGGSAGAVELLVQTATGTSGCTGAVVGTDLVVTAAHCFDGAFGNTTHQSGGVNIKLNYAITGTTWSCMTSSPSGADGKCTDWRELRVFRGTGARPDWDYAIVMPRYTVNSWLGIAGRPIAEGLYTGGLNHDWYREYGRGYYYLDSTGSGVMRYLTEQLDSVFAQHVETTADATRICKGDSGGPSYLMGTRWEFAVASLAHLVNTTCVSNGGTVYASRITREKMAAINAYRNGVGAQSCVEGPVDFWTCP